MGKKFLVLVFVLVVRFAAGQSITSSDTLIFDLSGINYSGNYILVPVYFHSDDTVYTIDFSMRFNLLFLSYDSIIVHHTGVFQAANFNWGDSTLYFTSYCMQPLPHDTPIISVRFNLLSSPIDASYFNNVLAYLNGDVCSHQIIPPPLDVSVSLNNAARSLSLYPNPTSNIFNVVVPENADAQLLNASGSAVVSAHLDANQKYEINTTNLDNGIYLLRIYNRDFSLVKKVLIQK